ncbi:MAG: alpha/beta hydrolase [Paracoccaceae bacterium]|nr:alpha/beta hydrolase [Paracoccaceae bacterium]
MAVAEAAPPLPDDISIEDMRKLNFDFYSGAARAAIDEYNVSLQGIEIAGIPCLHITPNNVTSGRVMLYIFGGGFMVGSPFEDLPISAALAASLNCPVICPKYRLAPEHPFPAALDDVEAVARILLASDDEVIFAGESAGGNLTLALHQRLQNTAFKLPVAIAVLSPATDLSDLGDSGLADRDPLLTQARVEGVNDAYVPNMDLTSPEISPIFGVYGPKTPPTLITTGTRDLLLSSCVRQERVMREAGATVTLRVWEGQGHVFEYFPDITESRVSLSEIAEFLSQHLN